MNTILKGRISRPVLLATLCLLTQNALGQGKVMNIYVSDPRPVEAAVVSLLSSYPIVITYEDPHYEYSGDIEDVTEQVRKQPTANSKPILIPRGGLLQASYIVPEQASERAHVAEALQRVIEAKNLDPVGGRFEVVQSADALHVVPTSIRDSSGSWKQQGSILDAPITISTPDLQGYELIEAILKEIGKSSGAQILGLSAERYASALARYRGTAEATNEPGRQVLLRTVHAINDRFGWLLNYDPSGGYYIFALTLAAAPEPDVSSALPDAPKRRAPPPVGERPELEP